MECWRNWHPGYLDSGTNQYSSSYLYVREAIPSCQKHRNIDTQVIWNGGCSLKERKEGQRCMGRTSAVSCSWDLSLGLTLRRVSAPPGSRARHQMPSVRYQGALTAVLWRSSHHCPFKEDGEAEIVCGLPEVLQLVSAGLGREPHCQGPIHVPRRPRILPLPKAGVCGSRPGGSAFLLR